MQVRARCRTPGPIAILTVAALVCCPACVGKSKYAQSQGDLADCQDDLAECQVRIEAQEASAVVSQSFYDGLVTAMQDEMATNQIAIAQMKSGVVVQLPEAVLFASGSAHVNEKGKEVLKKVAEELKGVPYQTIVAGFTDNVPIGGKLAEIYPSNWDLAAARAADVAGLLQQNGVPKDRLMVISFGENNPVAPNDTPDGRAKNRRIEIRLRPVAVFE